MRMRPWILSNTSNCWTNTHMSFSSCFSNHFVLPVNIAYLPYCRIACWAIRSNETTLVESMALLRCYDAGDQKDTCDSNLNANKAIKGLGGTSMADVSQPDFLPLSAKDPTARVPEGVVERVILVRTTGKW